MSGSGEAFVKGGLGCLGLFLIVGLFFVLIGGSMHIDAGGAIMLFVIGGVIGLIVMAIYKRGYKEGRHGPRRDPFDEEYPDSRREPFDEY